MRLGAVALAAAVACACGPRREGPQLRPDAPDAAGLYRATAFDGTSRSRFRLWVHVRRPDRLHLEVIAPVGGTLFVLDAGDGAVAASWPRERLAIEGRSDPASMERLVGIPLDAAAWVGTILDGAEAGPVGVTREGPAGGLPQRLTLRRDPLEIRLEREDVRGVRGEVGNGRSPEGFEVRPLAAMEGPSLLDALLDGGDGS